MKAVLTFACWSVLALPAHALAEEVKTVGNSHVSPIMNTVTSTSKDGRICKRVLRTGSRLGDNQICKSKEEWDQIAQDARKATERKQIFMSKSE